MRNTTVFPATSRAMIPVATVAILCLLGIGTEAQACVPNESCTIMNMDGTMSTGMCSSDASQCIISGGTNGGGQAGTSGCQGVLDGGTCINALGQIGTCEGGTTPSGALPPASQFMNGSCNVGSTNPMSGPMPTMSGTSGGVVNPMPSSGTGGGGTTGGTQCTLSTLGYACTPSGAPAGSGTCGVTSKNTPTCGTIVDCSQSGTDNMSCLLSSPYTFGLCQGGVCKVSPY